MLARVGRRWFLRAGAVGTGALAAGALADGLGLGRTWARQTTRVSHPMSDQLVLRLRTQLSFQISVDVATIDHGLRVAAAALAGGITIVEMGTPLIKNEGVANVVPALRKRFPDALLLADMKTMDGGAGEARGVYAGGGNIVDFLALAGVDTAKAICGVRDEFRKASPNLPRLAFADILVPHQGPAGAAADVARRMLDAGVDGVGIHLQADARRVDPQLIESDYLGEMARAVYARVGATAPVQVVGGLHVAQARRLAQAGLKAFVISGNLGVADTRARYDLAPGEIERHVATFISGISAV